jgi:hypothetical protein
MPSAWFDQQRSSSSKFTYTPKTSSALRRRGEEEEGFQAHRVTLPITIKAVLLYRVVWSFE